MSILTNQKIFAISELVISKKDSAGINLIVILDESEGYFRIDGMASEVWDRLLEKKNIPDIYQELTKKYPGNDDRVAQDLEAFITKLIELKILL